MSKSNNSKRTRFAIYTRYSSELQNDLSLEAQENRCRQAITERGGAIVNVFSDGARSGWSLEREGFMKLCREAERGKLDAVMFWKFDRLARNHEHAVMIKMLLRHEYGLKLYCVEGFSEDEDDSPYTAMMEQMLAVFSAFYSKNLSSETKRGKRQRVLKGGFNGSVPPLGYSLVTLSEATENKPSGLYIIPRLAAIVRRAFRMYATGKHSDYTIAKWMNSRKEIQQLRQGKKPIAKEMVRDLLQNRIYTGRVPYAETLYSGSLGQGKQSNRKRKEWFEGKHDAFISDELFETCQEVRQSMTKTRRPPEIMRTYILHDRVYCARCTARKPTTLEDANYGKMRPSWDPNRDKGWYRCVARDRGYLACEQPLIETATLDEQVVAQLSQLTIPDGFRERVEQAVRSNVENDEALKRMAEIEEAVKRVDFSWEKGFLTPKDYIEKRNQLQREIESLRPVDYDDLIEAADLLENFSSYWEACTTVEKPAEAQKQLLAKIVDRIFIYDNLVIAIALHGDYAVVLDHGGVAPDEIVEKLRSETTRGTSDEACTSCAQSGSDGFGGCPGNLGHPSENQVKIVPNVSISTTIRLYQKSTPNGVQTIMFSQIWNACRSLFNHVKETIKTWTKPTNVTLAIGALTDLSRTKTDLLVENAMLRQQLIVLKRSVKRPKFTTGDRTRLTLLARFTNFWQSALHIVQPDTILRWHRDMFKRYWKRISRPKTREPFTPRETIALFKQMARENHLWGAEKIQGELLKLGIEVGKPTIQKYMKQVRRTMGGQSWSTFLRNHAREVWACDFTVTHDLLFRPIYSFVIIAHHSREIVHSAVTRHPTDAWVAQQL